MKITAADNARGQNRSKQTKLNTRSQESVRLGDAWDDYLGKCHSSNGKATTRKDLESLGIRLSYGDAKDLEKVGFTPWRSAFYVVRDINNFLLLLATERENVCERRRYIGM